ncbi:hypothetical protein F8M41_008312 [Gigaspora margarita]|uniref:Uncharacterized protein n=1 Tax=Gigaspora margarita TaxID=4874 RepID=A0A8H4EQY1_GIGMA|nr:hypothetical protein F8M41_008312 [Gigaspora margarita]
MKLSSLLYNVTLKYLFFCLIITLTKSQQVQYKYFNYTESELSNQNSSPLIVDIKTYDDRTILVHIIRNESTQRVDCSKLGGMSLEQKLRIRIIFLNGTVQEVNPKLSVDPINYCLLNNDGTEYKINKLNNIVTYLNDTKNNQLSILYNLVNPITIYPLQKPFILITYVNTTNSSDPKSYRECGEVIDWDGNSRSNMCFDGAWINSIIQLNANKKLGFLRCIPKSKVTWQWQQFSIDDNGMLTSLTNLTNLIPNFGNGGLDPHYSLITIVSTIDNGYLAIFNFTQRINQDNLLIPHGGLCANFIPYNYMKAYASQSIGIYQIPQYDMMINSVYCDQATRFITCIVSISNNIMANYIVIYLYSPVNVEGFYVINQTQQGLRGKIMPFGGYILGVTAYDNNNNNTYHYIYTHDDQNHTLKSPGPLLTNCFGVNAIIQNATFLLASPYTNDNISWSLITIPLPKPSYNHDHGYDNAMINKTIPSINANVYSLTTFLNITFNVYIAFSMSTSNITIYKSSDNSIRQRVSATMYDLYEISPDGNTVSIKVINSTFNEYGEQYFVTMDNNFFKLKDIDVPIRGIHVIINRLVFFFELLDSLDNQKIYSDKVITGSVRLTKDVSKQFHSLLKNNQSEYIDNLLDELANKLPINRSCLRSDSKFHNEFYDQIVIFIRIDLRYNEIKRITSEVSSDLNNMIIYKNITTFSLGVTNDLDQGYGFKPMWNVWNEYKVQITISVGIIILIFCLLFPILSYKLKSNKIGALSYAILRLGLIIPNFILSILFVVYNSKNVQELYSPSIFVLSVPLFINFYIANYTVYKWIKNPVIGENFKKWVMNYRGLMIIIIILTATDYEYLTILKVLPMCTDKLYHYEQVNIFNIFDHNIDNAILWGVFVDIFFRNIPQIIIQVYYYNYGFLLKYDIIPLLLFVTTNLKIFIPIFNYICKKVALIIARHNFYGKCTKCNRPFISPTWCQLCDPQEAIKGWASKNKNIDEYIKKFQIKVTEYENMVEWIPFDRLINIQKIREKESEIIFMATWLDGIRIIKGDHLEYCNG